MNYCGSGNLREIKVLRLAILRARRNAAGGPRSPTSTLGKLAIRDLEFYIDLGKDLKENGLYLKWHVEDAQEVMDKSFGEMCERVFLAYVTTSRANPETAKVIRRLLRGETVRSVQRSMKLGELSVLIGYIEGFFNQLINRDISAWSALELTFE